jgi:hypothetical protein
VTELGLELVLGQVLVLEQELVPGPGLVLVLGLVPELVLELVQHRHRTRAR